ncbi:lipid-A-disaccharide synthase-related protein [Pannus brasiliensis CCIBt3594]|uniref:Lipid-A-disaccharide synthase-related protein n=1 Tax=Pannus brasiliensis CCIBt3594 TaxID=1427578 RepID=A0AAW9QV09_9CHRO
MTFSKRILFISNGHGEDNHSSYIIQTLRELCPSIEIVAMPLVGEGQAYRRLHIPIIGPTRNLPSGGFSYMNRLLLLKDIQAGLLGLTWQQLQAVRKVARDCDLIHATGDGVGQSFAYLTGRPFVSFISCLSSLYEGRLNLDPILKFILRSPRCLTVFTRDPYTAKDLQAQGLSKVQFGGIPSLDRLLPTGKDLHLDPGVPMLALLPGSRLPEAEDNLRLQLRLAVEIAKISPPRSVQFRAALVSGLMAKLPEIATGEGWQYEGEKIIYPSAEVEIRCYNDAFNDILHKTTLVIGMAGLAVDQAVAIGKPVIQIPGKGPQFTYAFAEAQTRLLGISAQTIGTEPATPEILRQAARGVLETLADKEYLAACVKNGIDRLGTPGASFRIARYLLETLGETPVETVNITGGAGI